MASDAFRTPEALREYLLSSDRQRLIAACAGGRLVVWDTATGVQVASFMTPITEPTSLAMGADGKCLAVAGHDGTIRLLDGRERK